MIATTAQMGFETAVRYTGNISVDFLRVIGAYQGVVGSQDQFMSTMLSKMPRHPELADFLETPLSIIDGIGVLLLRYQEDGTLKPEHPLHAVAALLGPLIIINMISASSTAAPIPPIDLENHIACFLNGRTQR